MPVRTTNRLGRQITLAFLIYGVVLVSSLGLSFVIALRLVESNILKDTLHAELAEYLTQAEGARAQGTFSSGKTAIFVAREGEVGGLPPYLYNLPAGMHNITMGGRDYGVLVERVADTRYAVRFDSTDIGKRERKFIRLVWLISFVALIFAISVGWLFSRRVNGPVTRLANQVSLLEKDPDSKLDLASYKDDEIGLLARKVQRYHDQFQLLLTREKEFAGNVSHELRTPVTNISLAAEVLASKALLNPKDQERVQRIQRAAREMAELIDTFLVLASIDKAAGAGCSACDVLPIVEDVLERQRVWLGDKPVTVMVERHHNLQVSAPPRIVSVLIANLVRNAFRYTQRGSITVSVEADRVSVTDTGAGIDAATQRRVFERHVRGPAGDKDGAGLGLAIVQRICECYGWVVTLNSQEGKGSTFCVQFAIKKTGVGEACNQ